MDQCRNDVASMLEQIGPKAHAAVDHRLIEAYLAGYSNGFKEHERIEKQKETISADLLKFATADSLNDAFPDLPGDDA